MGELDAARLVHPGLHPVDVLEWDPGILGEPAPGVDRRGLRPFRYADPLAGEVRDLAHRPVRGDVPGRMPENAGNEDRDTDDRRVGLGHDGAVLGEGKLGNVPLEGAREAVEDLLDVEIEPSQVDPLGADLALEQVPGVVVLVHRKRQVDVRHVASPPRVTGRESALSPGRAQRSPRDYDGARRKRGRARWRGARESIRRPPKRRFSLTASARERLPWASRIWRRWNGSRRPVTARPTSCPR